jgi:hypothetical protein
LLRRLSAADEGGFKSKTLDGIPVVTVYSRSQATKWAVVLGMPQDELRAGLAQSLTWLIVASFAALGIGLLLAWLVGGRIAKSITALVEPALALGSGAMPPIPQLLFREANELRQALLDAAMTLHRSDAERQRAEEALRTALADLGARNAALLLTQEELQARESELAEGELTELEPARLAEQLVAPGGDP